MDDFERVLYSNIRSWDDVVRVWGELIALDRGRVRLSMDDVPTILSNYALLERVLTGRTPDPAIAIANHLRHLGGGLRRDEYTIQHLMVAMRQALRRQLGSRDRPRLDACQTMVSHPFFARPVVDKGTNAVRISLYLSHDHAVQDRRTVVKVGKAVKLAYPDFDEVMVHRLAERITQQFTPMKLELARTEDEIEAIYTDSTNFRSCMSDSTWEHTDGVHPARVYATDDCAVAYAKKGGRVVARAVVNMANKTWARRYGDPEFAGALAAAGFTHKWNALVGCRLQLITVDKHDTFVLPYIDSSHSGTSISDQLGVFMPATDDEYLVVCHPDDAPGDYVDSNHETGLANCRLSTGERCSVSVEALETCHCCGQHYPAEDARESVDGDICPSCANQSYVWAYTGTRTTNEERVHHNDAVYCETDAEYYHEGHPQVVRIDDNHYRIDDDNICQLYNGDYALEEDAVEILGGDWELEEHAISLDYPEDSYTHRDAEEGTDYVDIGVYTIGFDGDARIDTLKQARIIAAAHKELDIDEDDILNWCEKHAVDPTVILGSGYEPQEAAGLGADDPDSVEALQRPTDPVLHPELAAAGA